MNSNQIFGLIFLMWILYLIIKDYKRTHKLALITNKVNFTNEEYYFDILLTKNDKYKRIKVSQEVFCAYKVGEKIIW